VPLKKKGGWGKVAQLKGKGVGEGFDQPVPPGTNPPENMNSGGVGG